MAEMPNGFPARPASYDKKVGLVLQGGGALGSYQAGVYEALASSEYLPDWVAGISIGAINAALIAGNRSDDRLKHLRAFWNEITSHTGWWPDGLSWRLWKDDGDKAWPTHKARYVLRHGWRRCQRSWVYACSTWVRPFPPKTLLSVVISRTWRRPRRPNARPRHHQRCSKRKENGP